MIRGYRFRLYPTAEQEEALRKTVGVCRMVYNLALEQRRDWWRHHRTQTGQPITFASQCRELTDLRAEFDWIAAVNRTAQEQALRDLDQAFANFFSRRAKFPTPRKLGETDTFRVKGPQCRIVALNAKWALVKLPVIGAVRFRITRPINGDLRNVTVSRKAGSWFVSLGIAVEARASAAPFGAVGIDRGVANSLALSTGEITSLPPTLFGLADRRRRAQRVLSRRKRGSGRHAAQRAKVARLHAKLSRSRADWLHKQSTSIARRFGVVAMEALNVASMTRSAAGSVERPGSKVAQKRGLNRSILHQGWGIFATQLAYKLEERGGHLLTCNPAYTSQTCALCGTIDARSRESQAAFRCVHCGHADHADVNAAKNILRQSMALLDVEGAHSAPREASTFEPLAA